jgi:hypothetical protein
MRALPAAVLGVLLAASPLAHTSPNIDPFDDDSAAAEPADPFADDSEAAESVDADSDDGPRGAGGGEAAAGSALHPDLAADAPQGEWVSEGGGGDGGSAQDPRALNRKIRRAGRITLAGGAIVVLGGVTALAGTTLLYVWSPQKRLVKLADKNGGYLPTDDASRHRIISSANTAPIVIYAGLGVLAAGVVTAVVGRIRLKKLREQRKAATVSLSPSFYRGGAALGWEVRF